MGVDLVHPLVFLVFQRTLQLGKINIFVSNLVAFASLCIALALDHMKENPLVRLESSSQTAPVRYTTCFQMSPV